MKTLLLSLVMTLLLSGCMKEELLLPSTDLTGGTWKSQCLSGTLATGAPAHLQLTMTFDGTNQVMETTAYSSSNCTGSKLLGSTERYGYVVGGASSYNTDAIEIDYTLQSITAVVYSSSVATDFNNQSYCGTSTWTVGQAKNIEGLTCGTSTVPTAGTVSYDIYEIVKIVDISSGAGSGDLLIGMSDGTYDGSTPAKRHRYTAPIYFTKN
ncbi:hypothetical protein [Bdellovibrio sp. HCB2-146]|uniref:hypothetical protein n=1 Tax=Bdellovibrio sp. HCB2-146 TaxID=3394362 RepID=UPI0039BD5BBE